MRSFVLGWVFAATFYTCLDVTIKIYKTLGGTHHYIIYAGIMINIIMNYLILGVLRRKNPWQ